MSFVVYKWICKDSEILQSYIGSTGGFPERKRHHKLNLEHEQNRHYHYKHYQFIREHGGWDNWEFVFLETFEEISTADLLLREKYWIKTTKYVLNIRVPARSSAELYQDKREEKIEYQKKYRLENFDKIKTRKDERFQCECGSNIRRDEKGAHFKTKKHKKYFETLIIDEQE